ncbi:MAG: hypothetical protein IJC44_02885, partial [Clostridia bacterium]|nr:hypothetical protein [Clostridia bacterium]
KQTPWTLTVTVSVAQHPSVWYSLIFHLWSMELPQICGEGPCFLCVQTSKHFSPKKEIAQQTNGG